MEENRLYYNNLLAFREFLNETLERNNLGEQDLIYALKMHYKLQNKECNKVLQLVNELSPVKNKPTLDKKVAEKINNSLNFLELSPRKHDPSNPNVKKIKQLLTQKISKVKKELSL